MGLGFRVEGLGFRFEFTRPTTQSSREPMISPFNVIISSIPATTLSSLPGSGGSQAAAPGFRV